MAVKSINIAFPLKDDDSNGFLLKTNKLTIDAVKSDLKLLLLTSKGERWYYPEYGTNLIKYLFEPNDDLTLLDILDDIKNTVNKFLPKINILNVELNDDPDNENARIVDIKFQFNDGFFSDTDSIQIRFS